MSLAAVAHTRSTRAYAGAASRDQHASHVGSAPATRDASGWWCATRRRVTAGREVPTGADTTSRRGDAAATHATACRSASLSDTAILETAARRVAACTRSVIGISPASPIYGSFPTALNDSSARLGRVFSACAAAEGASAYGSAAATQWSERRPRGASGEDSRAESKTRSTHTGTFRLTRGQVRFSKGPPSSERLLLGFF